MSGEVLIAVPDSDQFDSALSGTSLSLTQRYQVQLETTQVKLQMRLQNSLKGQCHEKSFQTETVGV